MHSSTPHRFSTTFRAFRRVLLDDTHFHGALIHGALMKVVLDVVGLKWILRVGPEEARVDVVGCVLHISPERLGKIAPCGQHREVGSWIHLPGRHRQPEHTDILAYGLNHVPRP